MLEKSIQHFSQTSSYTATIVYCDRTRIARAMPDPIRVVSFIEASTVTGPARNLIRFAVNARAPHPDLPRVELSIATFLRGKASNGFLDAVHAAGIEIDIIAERARFDPASLRQMAAIVRRRQPHIVQTHAVKSHFLMWLSRLWKQYPWLGIHHGYTAEDFKMRMYNRLDAISLPAARHIVTVCSPFAGELTAAGIDAGKISVLPNSIDLPPPVLPQEVAELRNSLGLAAHEHVILSIGRFSSEKAPADLVPAVALLVRRCPDLACRVVLVGDGVERGHITAAVAAHGLQRYFVFPGFRANVAPFYGMADLFALPSHSEGSPNVLLEAMAYGVPIAATRVGGVPETVEHGLTALLTPVGDAVAMAAAMERILTEPGLASAMAMAGRESVRVRFSPHAYRARMTAIYSECLASRRSH